MAGENATDTPAGPTGLELVQAEALKVSEQGYVGEKVDPNPNEVYTIAGVTGQLKSSKKS